LKICFSAPSSTYVNRTRRAKGLVYTQLSTRGRPSSPAGPCAFEARGPAPPAKAGRWPRPASGTASACDRSRRRTRCRPGGARTPRSRGRDEHPKARPHYRRRDSRGRNRRPGAGGAPACPRETRGGARARPSRRHREETRVLWFSGRGVARPAGSPARTPRGGIAREARVTPGARTWKSRTLARGGVGPAAPRRMDGPRDAKPPRSGHTRRAV
jgi:hypothetical protein